MKSCPYAAHVVTSHEMNEVTLRLASPLKGVAKWAAILKRLIMYFKYAAVNSYYLRQRNVLNFIAANANKQNDKNSYEPSVCFSTLINEYHFLLQTNLIKTILHQPRLDQGEFLSEGRQLRVIADALGRMRLSKNQKDMKQKRSILAELLSKPQRYLPEIFNVVDIFIARLLAKNSGDIDVNHDLQLLTAEIFLRPVFNYRGDCAPIVSILEKQIDLLGKRLIYKNSLGFKKKFQSLRTELKTCLCEDQGVLKTTNYMESVSAYINEHHKKQFDTAFAIGLNGGTLAGYLAPYPTFIAAVYELGLRPDLQAQLFEEYSTSLAAGMNKIDYIRSEKTLLHAVIHEIMRLHPAQPFIFRKVENNCYINTIFFSKNSQLIADFYHALRDGKIWGENAHLFEPQRFLKNPALYHEPFLVYSTGPNNCTGQQFSRLTLKVLLSYLTKKLAWQVTNAPLEHEFHFALNFNKNLNIKIYSLN